MMAQASSGAAMNNSPQMMQMMQFMMQMMPRKAGSSDEIDIQVLKP
jgi:hypothetical protein